MRKMKDSGIQWIGQIPEDWDVIKFKYLFSIIGGNGFPDNLQGNKEGDYPFCKVSDINSDSEYVDKATNYVTKEVVDLNHYNLIPINSIIMAKIGVALMKNHRKINTVECCIDNNTQALIPCRNDNIKYLYYLSKLLDMKWFDNNGTIPSVNNNKLLNFFVPNIALIEQTRIANFLDQKCSAIDSVLEKTKASIEEYKKLKQSVITQAVTKGIRPNRQMKDSGVEWIGQIPEDWRVAKIKHYLKWKSIKGQPNALVLSLYRDYGIIPKDSRDDNHNVTSLDTGEYKVVNKGDFVINKMKAWQGSMAVSNYDGIVSPAYHVCEFTSKDVVKKYFHYLMRNTSYTPEYLRLSTGLRVGQWDLGFDDFKNLPFLLPPIAEQQAIADYLDAKCTKIDNLIAKKEQFVKEIETYKKSLIYEYVTGKKEVI